MRKAQDNSRTYWGVDCGSSAIKVCACDAEGRMVLKRKAKALFPLPEHVYRILRPGSGAPSPLNDRGVKPGHRVVATGYGRHHIECADQRLTEIKAHYLGAEYHCGEDGDYTIIDIGGQDSKVIRVQAHRVTHFVINRKCAAGTGAFIEELAHRLEVPLGDMTRLAAAHDKPLRLNSYCTVFSGQEVIKTLMDGEKIENLIHALYTSVVERIVEMTGIETPRVLLSGGVANYHPTLQELFVQRLPDARFELLPDAQYCGALGAARYGMQARTPRAGLRAKLITTA